MTSKRALTLRLSLFLLISACGQSAFETYGCACTYRKYSADEIKRYRELAESDNLLGLAEMEEYHRWRKNDHDEGDLSFIQEERLERRYLDRRVALADPEAIKTVVYDLILQMVRNSTKTRDRVRLAERARALIQEHPTGFTVFDLWDSSRKPIDAKLFVERELGLIEDLGDAYYIARMTDQDFPKK